MAPPSPPPPHSPPPLEQTADYTALLSSSAALIDVRSPGEFALGALPNAVNLPILLDDERARVGTCYKQHGREAAIELGHRLVDGGVRTDRITAWTNRAEDSLAIYCARGGLRSQIAQQWLAEAGQVLPRVDGGFKALRNACLATLDQPRAEQPWWVVGGRTGSGKTILIQQCAAAIDLEALANHRGSAFGALPDGQPTPINFENALAVNFLNHRQPIVVLEDESRTIGRLALPAAWHERMQAAPIAMVVQPFTERVANIRAEYVALPLADGTTAAALLDHYLNALNRIKRRLGAERHTRLTRLLNEAFATTDTLAGHDLWIGSLLRDYYDPMYDYQLEKKRERIRFEGSRAQVLEYLSRETAKLSDRAHAGAQRALP